jgi:MFS family permease
MLAPLRIRDFRFLWTGMTVSLIGDGIFFVAIAWQVYQLSNSPTALAVVGFAMSLPHVLLLLVGGVVTDRFDRRKVMFAADVVRGAAIAAIGVLAITDNLTVTGLLPLIAIYGAGTAFFGPAFDAIVPDVVPRDLLAEANALDQFVRPGALRLAGPALGGVIVAGAGAGWAFVLDAGTFGIGALSVMRMRPVTRDSRDGTYSTMRELKAGFRFVRSRVWLWGTFLSATIAYLLFMGPTEVLIPFVVKNDLGGGAADLGAVFAFGGLGAIAAAVFVGQTGIPRRHMTFMYGTWAVATLSVAGYGIAVLPWQVMAASFLFNALETAGTVAWATTKHRLVPARMLGRVASFDWFISIGLLPVSFAITGPVAAAIGAQATLVGAGLIGGVVTLAFLFLPGMRDIEREGLLTRSAVPKEGLGEALAGTASTAASSPL